jgi:hypothetical protein
MVKLARREPLPPTIRRRDYIWEVFAARGIRSVAVNWWTSDDMRLGALDSVGQASIFTADPLAVDQRATKRLLTLVDQTHPQFATVYLPALDVILNRLMTDRSTQLAGSVRALDAISSLITETRSRGYDVLLVGSDVIGSTFPVAPPRSPFDLAPTLCALLGFPASDEMAGKSLVPEALPRIASYGPRTAKSENTKVNEEYYRNLKSLGYIR